MATGFGRNERTILAQQEKAWRYYGIPVRGRRGKKADYEEPVGEIRYVVGWMSDQMSRMRWRVLVDGSEQWSLKLPDGTTVTASEKDPDSLLDASEKVLDVIGWGPNTVREITTNLFVAGELDYIAEKPDDAKEDDTKSTWRCISVIFPDRDEVVDQAAKTVRGLWPHPANPSLPDAPIFGVLPLLEELSWLSKLSRSQSASRIGMRGVMGISDNLTFANGGDVWEEIKKSINEKMVDPTNASPLVLRGATELTKPDGSNGMGGLSWVVPNFPYDARIDDQMTTLIQRLAYGLPIPPEILLGMNEKSRATAFQVEENSYRAHIEPPATLVASIAAKALEWQTGGKKKITVIPDASDLLARRHSVQDVKDALLVGGVGFEYYREVLDIPDSATPTPEDIALLLLLKSGPNTPATDPGDSAAKEPVVASVGTPDGEPLNKDELTKLSNDLTEIDRTLISELSGATQQATDRAREKVGVKARTHNGLRAAIPDDTPNSQVAAKIGSQVLSDTGVPVEEIVAQAIAPLLDWWDTRIRHARTDLETILGPDSVGKLDDSFLDRSTDVLADLMGSHIIDTLESPTADPLSVLAIRTVLAVASGSPT